MNELTKQYEKAKNNAKVFMQNGTITAYLNTYYKIIRKNVQKIKRLMN